MNNNFESVESNPEAPESENPWVTKMKDVDDFSTHMAKMGASTEQRSKAQAAMEMVGVVESRGDEAKFEEDLANLSGKDASRMLSMINGTLTGTKRSERFPIGHGVWGGTEINGHLSPAPEVQSAAIDETFDAIKDIKNNGRRAALAYYMINHLHSFSDGNGRTARAAYEIFNNKSFQLGGDAFIHNTRDESEIGGRENFREKNNLQPDTVVFNLTLDLVKKDLAESSQLPRKMTELNCRLNLPKQNRPMPDVYLTRDAEKNLTNMEKVDVQHAFFENQIATVALGMMLKKKYRDWEIIEENTKEDFSSGQKYVLFGIENKDGAVAKDILGDWSADDYRDFCKTVKDIQLQQARKLIDVFKNENKYQTSDGRTYAEWLSG